MDASGDLPDETRRSSDEDIFQTSNNADDRFRSAQEQLAELQLLARAGQHSPATASLQPSDEIAAASSTLVESEETKLNKGESYGRPRVGTGGLSSFTAILAASRKLAISSPDSVDATNPAIAPSDQIHQTSTGTSRCSSPKSSGKSLPTLNEGAEGEEDDDDDQETPERASNSTATSFPDKLLILSVDGPPGIQEQEPEQGDSDDVDFVEMLEHISRGKVNFLALTVEDLRVCKLKRVHAALTKARSSMPTMSYVRTLISVDMLQLLLLRLGDRVVREAITHGIQQNSKVAETLDTADPSALLTSANIAAVVLMARRELATVSTATSSPAPQLPRRTTTTTRRSSQTSPKPSSSPSSSVSSSPRCGTPRNPASDRRSILAKEGVQVLMQEKLVSFDHRGQANALPAFRVRGASAAITDSAAKRRQRGLQYASEHVTHRTVHM
ncbi:unnamed protein product [Phytophthora lilii]|uniref:Unnamed protein product n=1 Tax=Phytophthora lilii TaxID=2077276 RepID=A0A9W6UAL9_9STRA|nr:unnamed protein product [Phytophthora lilii]